MSFWFVALFINGIAMLENVQAAVLQKDNLFAIRVVGEALQFVGSTNATFEVCSVNDQGTLVKSVRIATADDIKMLNLTYSDLKTALVARDSALTDQQNQITVLQTQINLLANLLSQEISSRLYSEFNLTTTAIELSTRLNSEKIRAMTMETSEQSTMFF